MTRQNESLKRTGKPGWPFLLPGGNAGLSRQKEARDNLRERLSQGLGEIYKEQIGIQPQEVEVRFAGDLILARYKGTLSPPEVHLLNQRDGRQLLRQFNEQIYQKLHPQFDVLLQKLVGRYLRRVQIELFPERGEKLFLFTLSGPVELAQETF